MHRITAAILLFSAAVFSSTAQAQSPVEITRQLIKNIQEKGTLDAVVDHIDWQAVFDGMSPAQRLQMGIKSPDDLKKKDVEAYDGLGDKVSQNLARALKNAPPDKAAVLNAMQERLNKSLDQQKDASQSAFSETVYSIGTADIQDTTAQVELIKTRGKTVKSDTLDFVKVGGEWKLKSGAPFNPTSSTQISRQLDGPLGQSISYPSDGLIRLY